MASGSFDVAFDIAVLFKERLKSLLPFHKVLHSYRNWLQAT